MTDALAMRCVWAVHVITPDGTVLGAGRASLYVFDCIGWRRFARVFSRRPLVWLVEIGYRVVARNRGFFSHVFFRARSDRPRDP